MFLQALHQYGYNKYIQNQKYILQIQCFDASLINCSAKIQNQKYMLQIECFDASPINCSAKISGQTALSTRIEKIRRINIFSDTTIVI